MDRAARAPRGGILPLSLICSLGKKKKNNKMLSAALQKSLCGYRGKEGRAVVLLLVSQPVLSWLVLGAPSAPTAPGRGLCCGHGETAAGPGHRHRRDIAPVPKPGELGPKEQASAQALSLKRRAGHNPRNGKTGGMERNRKSTPLPCWDEDFQTPSL